MAYNFLPYEEQQLYLLPTSIKDWVRDDSLARFVGETVDLLDQRGQLTGFYTGTASVGNAWGLPVHSGDSPRKNLLATSALLVSVPMQARLERAIAGGREKRLVSVALV